jgi:hypothetical protein
MYEPHNNSKFKSLSNDKRKVVGYTNWQKMYLASLSLGSDLSERVRIHVQINICINQVQFSVLLDTNNHGPLCC